MIECYGNNFVLKGDCAEWTAIPDSRRTLNYSTKYTTEEGCKTACLQKTYGCESVDWDVKAGACYHHLAGTNFGLFSQPGIVHWKMNRTQCEGMISEKESLIYSKKLG